MGLIKADKWYFGVKAFENDETATHQHLFPQIMFLLFDFCSLVLLLGKKRHMLNYSPENLFSMHVCRTQILIITKVTPSKYTEHGLKRQILFVIGKMVRLPSFLISQFDLLIHADLCTDAAPGQKRAVVSRTVATRLDPVIHQAVIDPSCDDLPA